MEAPDASDRLTPARRLARGFTLMEMLIVVAIIAVLVAIAIPTFQGQLKNAKYAADASNLRSYKSQIYADYAMGTYTQDGEKKTWPSIGRFYIATDGTFWSSPETASGAGKTLLKFQETADASNALSNEVTSMMVGTSTYVSGYYVQAWIFSSTGAYSPIFMRYGPVVYMGSAS